jgi:arginase
MTSTWPVEVITAPWNIGLRPTAAGGEPGTWRAPEVLLAAGLADRLAARAVRALPRPPYSADPQPGTRIRNGMTLREHSLVLADAVTQALDAGAFPVVVGGDCSVLLGCLVGARKRGACGLVHLDGHSDFTHPGSMTTGQLGAVAGMDLALVTARGEMLLTNWPGITGPLVADDHVVQLGGRDGSEIPVPRVDISELARDGMTMAAQRALKSVGLESSWLHVDLDVLDAAALPAVDSPGSPGLSFAQLTALMAELVGSGQILGLNIAIYDPSLDPGHTHAEPIVEVFASAMKREKK